MSKISDIKDSEQKLDPAKLFELLTIYDNELKELEERIRIKGKMLGHANRENPAWQNFYDQKKAELNSLQKYLSAQVDRTRSKLYKTYLETYNRDLSDRAIEKYIDGEPAYLTVYELFLEVKELHEQYEAAVDAFKSRGYALNNITKIRVASIEDDLV